MTLSALRDPSHHGDVEALGVDIVLAAQAAFAEPLYDVAADFPYEAFPTRA